jgi:hypothetical protein
MRMIGGRGMKRVFILGAGASKAIMPEAPLNDQLLSEIVKLKDDIILPLKKFILDFYGVDVEVVTDPKVLPSLEDILSQIDYCLSSSRPLSDVYTLQRLVILRDSLVYGMSKVLKQSMRSGELYWMIQFLKTLSKDDVIISLNYDLIVDNSLMRAEKNPDYGVASRQTVGRRNYPINDEHQKIKLYKLHGSLNWLYCPACQAMDITPHEKSVVYIFQNKSVSQCPTCGVRYDPVMITPTFLKNYDNNYLQQVWISAENALENADELVFIGYSLPDADMVLRMMFSRALYRNRLRRGSSPKYRYPKITVVDKWDDSRGKSPAQERYERVFGRIRYLTTGFQDYVKNDLRMQDDCK